MQTDRIPGDQPDDERQTTDDEDWKWQGRLLGVVFHEYPHQLTELELERELVGDNPSFAEKDAVARALDVVIKAGLLHRCESMIVVSKPALFFSRLEDL
jgi:hypothetical protein